MKPKAVILCDSPENISRVFGAGRLERLKKSAKIHPSIITGKNFDSFTGITSLSEYIFSTWGMPSLSVEQIKSMKKLKAVFYAAGSVKYFAGPYLKRGIRIISAWGANAVPTAAFAFSQILLSCKDYFRSAREYKTKKDIVWKIEKRGVYGCKVGILGAGKVGRGVIEMLKPFGCEIYIHDPYLTVKEAKKSGVIKSGIEKIFKECIVVSNHMPDTDETKGKIGAKLFGSMPDGAVFINSGRGAQVMENDLIKVFSGRRDLTALLDVTNPEPPDKKSKLFKLSNVIISPHIAGAYGKEQVLLADCVIDKFELMMKGKPLKYEISLNMLKNIG
ncbi:MAG: hydroxyacid dehydrogenase [Candidatus Goldiibacteriota bacterium]